MFEIGLNHYSPNEYWRPRISGVNNYGTILSVGSRLQLSWRGGDIRHPRTGGSGGLLSIRAIVAHVVFSCLAGLGKLPDRGTVNCQSVWLSRL